MCTMKYKNEDNTSENTQFLGGEPHIFYVPFQIWLTFERVAMFG